MSLSKHFVIFYMPGLMFSETAKMPMDSWDIDKAVELANGMKYRPYGFKFITKTRETDELDSRESARSAMHYFGGDVKTLAEIKARNDPKDAILIDNMACNGWGEVIITARRAFPFNPGDVLLKPLETAEVLLAGNEARQGLQDRLWGTYVGDVQGLKGERAIIMIADGRREFEKISGVYSFNDQGANAETVSFTPAKGTVLAQFDDPGTGFGFGWHPFTAKDFRLEDTDGNIVELPE